MKFEGTYFSLTTTTYEPVPLPYLSAFTSRNNNVLDRLAVQSDLRKSGKREIEEIQQYILRVLAVLPACLCRIREVISVQVKWEVAHRFKFYDRPNNGKLEMECVAATKRARNCGVGHATTREQRGNGMVYNAGWFVVSCIACLSVSWGTLFSTRFEQWEILSHVVHIYPTPQFSDAIFRICSSLLAPLIGYCTS